MEYLWADVNGDARMSLDVPDSDECGRVLNLEELGKLIRDRLVRIRKSGKREIVQKSSNLPFLEG